MVENAFGFLYSYSGHLTFDHLDFRFKRFDGLTFQKKKKNVAKSIL